MRCEILVWTCGHWVLDSVKGLECLSTADTAILLESVQGHARNSEVFRKTVDYCEKFCEVPNPTDNQQALRDFKAALESLKFTTADGKELQLEAFEVASLGTLFMKLGQDGGDAHDELKTFIPSLARLGDEALRKICHTIQQSAVNQ